MNLKIAPTRQDMANLNRRMGVSTQTLKLLSRADGLDILLPGEYAEEVLDLRDKYTRNLRYNESNQGVGVSDAGGFEHRVLVTEEVNYPVPGYPVARHL